MHDKLVFSWFFLYKLFTRLGLVVKCPRKITVLLMVKLRQKGEMVLQLRQKEEMKRKTMAPFEVGGDIDEGEGN
jgi:hypothetical protein